MVYYPNPQKRSNPFCSLLKPRSIGLLQNLSTNLTSMMAIVPVKEMVQSKLNLIIFIMLD